MAEAALRDDELRTLRAMMRAYRHDEQRRQVVDEFWTTGRKIVIFAAAVAMWATTMLASLYQIIHG